jgi:hypothetical protein
MAEKPVPGRDQILLGVFIVLCSVLGARAAGLTLKPDLTVADVTKLLQTLSIIALLVERSIEVFLVAWRGAAAAEKEGAVLSARRVLDDVRNQVPGAFFDQASPTLTTAEKERDDYAARTRAIRLVAALAVGVLIAATGVRAFETFFTQPPTGAVARAIFNSLNVFVTGGLIGGGSDVINKIIRLITETLDKTVDRLRGER